jgi:outer membrane protein OmpA-like peptidoglycan-associated protein
MNISTHKTVRFTRLLTAGFLISMIATGCATAPTNPAGSADVRSKLERLQSDPNLANQAPVEIREAEAAVKLSEQPVGSNVSLGEHRVYVADRKVEIAIAKASTRYAEEQRSSLSQARDDARLQARTREADRAHQDAAKAQSESAAANANAERAVKNAADAADAASVAAADSAQNAAKLQKQIDDLKAEATDRGLVLTLGNTLFETGRADLQPFATSSLDKLVVFLNDYPDRNVTVEGHTDNVGSVEMNQTLSQHRADSVKSYLVKSGIQSRRLTATGIGETQPIADNTSASGRQQNRRVEVIIENPRSVTPTASTN